MSYIMVYNNEITKNKIFRQKSVKTVKVPSKTRQIPSKSKFLVKNNKLTKSVKTLQYPLRSRQISVKYFKTL